MKKIFKVRNLEFDDKDIKIKYNYSTVGKIELHIFLFPATVTPENFIYKYELSNVHGMYSRLTYFLDIHKSSWLVYWSLK